MLQAYVNMLTNEKLSFQLSKIIRDYGILNTNIHKCPINVVQLFQMVTPINDIFEY